MSVASLSHSMAAPRCSPLLASPGRRGSSATGRRSTPPSPPAGTATETMDPKRTQLPYLYREVQFDGVAVAAELGMWEAEVGCCCICLDVLELPGVVIPTYRFHARCIVEMEEVTKKAR